VLSPSSTEGKKKDQEEVEKRKSVPEEARRSEKEAKIIKGEGVGHPKKKIRDIEKGGKHRDLFQTVDH